MFCCDQHTRDAHMAHEVQKESTMTEQKFPTELCKQYMINMKIDVWKDDGDSYTHSFHPTILGGQMPKLCFFFRSDWVGMLMRGTDHQEEYNKSRRKTKRAYRQIANNDIFVPSITREKSCGFFCYALQNNFSQSNCSCEHMVTGKR